jgi:esterase/lipase superfamily enzyme
MNREHHRWYSPSLNREMELLVFGHAGAKLLVFPTSQGRFYEWEDRGMIHALSDHIGAGALQVYCVDSVDAESWYATWKHPVDRARRNEDYERYLLSEVMPFGDHRNWTPYWITTGASFGAYHAVNFAFRNPHRFDRVIGLSGLYDISRFADGYYDHHIYWHNPAHFIADHNDGGWLGAAKRLDTIIVTGQGDAFREHNEHFSGTLWRRGIWHAFRLWDGWAHDWPWWKQMIRLYVGGSA